MVGLLLSIMLCLCCVGTISYTVDPGRVYHPSKNVEAFADKLLDSTTGLTRPLTIWNRRDIKKQIAKSSKRIDCAVIGSSHVMQISSARKNKSLSDVCTSILNLGVPGAAIEDYLALTYILLERRKLPEKIVFGIDPWALDFGREHRWVRYENEYLLMKGKLENTKRKSFIDYVSTTEKMINLINPEYFKKSFENRNESGPEIVEVDKFNHFLGTYNDVMLSDGSIIYSTEFFETHTVDKIPIGGSNYKIKEGVQYSESTITLFTSLIKEIRRQGVSPIILLTPYHHNVWKAPYSETSSALISVEARIERLAESLNVEILGSYRPSHIGCLESEFFDHMHPTDTCLKRIRAENRL